MQTVRRATRDAGADALLVTDPTDVGYLTGFLGGDSWLVLPARGKPVVISDRRFEGELAELEPGVTSVMRAGAIEAALPDVLRRMGFDDGRRKLTLAVQAEHLTLSRFRGIESALRASKLKSRSILKSAGLVAAARRTKSAEEVKLIRKAISIQEKALLEVLPTVKPGMPESAIAAALEGAMKSLGSSAPGFDTIVASKASAAMPHYSPASRKTAKGGVLLIDWGATWKGYRGDMTRTFSLGKWSKRMAEVYDVVLEAHEAAAGALRPGLPCRASHETAAAVIREAGMGDRFTHSLGHGLGMDVHEAPALSHRAAEGDLLREGDVVTIEPGVYLPGVGGVRIEDDYLITSNGARNLCSLPRDRAWATL